MFVHFHMDTRYKIANSLHFISINILILCFQKSAWLLAWLRVMKKFQVILIRCWLLNAWVVCSNNVSKKTAWVVSSTNLASLKFLSEIHDTSDFIFNINRCIKLLTSNFLSWRVLRSAHIIWKLQRASLVQHANLTIHHQEKWWRWLSHKELLQPMEEKRRPTIMCLVLLRNNIEIMLEITVYFRVFFTLFYFITCVLNNSIRRPVLLSLVANFSLDWYQCLFG